MEDDTNTTMAQEDQTRNCSSGGGDGSIGRSSKKPKQKKVPQRGLGVAQLEKIRLEEQQKRDGAAILPSPNSVSSSSSSTISSYLPLPINNFNHSNQPSPTTPLVPSSGPPAEFWSPLSLQHMDAKVRSTVPLSNNSGGGFEPGWPAISVPGHGNVPKLWSSHELDFEKDSFGVESPGLPFLPTLPFESNPIWPLPNWVQRTPQYHHQPPSPMVNISSGTSSTPVPHLSIEPPSNQNYSGSGGPVRPTEKMVGMKRPYPFSLDFPHAPAFNYRLPIFAEISTNAKTSCESESGFHFDAGNSTSREVPSCSASNSEANSKKRNKGIKDFDGHFLTLATPTPISCPPSQFNSSTSHQECPEFESPSCQENIEDQFRTPPGYRLFNQQKQPLYSFFLPAAKEAQIGQTTARIQNCHEVGESVDLNLKL